MSSSILSHDILAICLILSKGNLNLSLEEVICKAEEYQKRNNRHFGITENDFRGLINNLIYFELGLKDKIDEDINDIMLSDVIVDILCFHDVYFNDEGEHWCKQTKSMDENLDFKFIEYWYGYNEKEYRKKLIMKNEMKRLFESQNIKLMHPELVNEFLGKMELTDNILITCSRPGRLS